MMDNSDIQQKIEIRQRGLTLLKNKEIKVLDLFAGEGIITKVLWSKIAKEVYCIEKEKGKLQLPLNNVKCFEEDNEKWIDESYAFNVIDMDAYGLIKGKIIKAITKAKSDSIIFFTEFNPIRYRNNWQAEFLFELMKFNIRGIYFQQAKNSQVIYGYVYV